jgi:hypothetical protein
MTTNILILAAGKMPYTEHRDEDYPMCLVEFDGVSLIERIILNTAHIELPKYTFAILESDAKRFHLDNVFKVLVENPKTIKIADGTMGSACTALLAASQLERAIPLLIISANELVDIDYSLPINNFLAQDIDAGTLIFPSIHPRYSFVKLNSDKMVVQVAQRNPISRHATAGVFWFKRTDEFIESAMSSIKKGAEVGGHYYVAPTINQLILKQRRVGVFEIDAKSYKPLKTEKQVNSYEHGVVV